MAAVQHPGLPRQTTGASCHAAGPRQSRPGRQGRETRREAYRASPGGRCALKSRLAVVLLAMTAAACAPVRVSHTNTVPTLRLESNRPATSELAGEPIAILGVLAPAGLQGFSPFLSHALVAALAEVTPPIPARSAYDTVNRLNAEGLAAEYSELVAGFARSGILERDRLRRIGSALGSRYVFLPGVAELSHTILD